MRARPVESRLRGFRARFDGRVTPVVTARPAWVSVPARKARYEKGDRCSDKARKGVRDQGRLSLACSLRRFCSAAGTESRFGEQVSSRTTEVWECVERQ